MVVVGKVKRMKQGKHRQENIANEGAWSCSAAWGAVPNLFNRN